MPRTDVGIAVEGDEALKRKLKALPDNLLRKVVSGATSHAMTPVQRAARSKVPTRMGLLKKAIGKKSKLYKRSMTAVTIVGARTGFKRQVRTKEAGLDEAWKTGEPMKAVYADPVKYAHLVEFGTGPHVIRVKNAEAMGPGGQYGKVVNHPGAKPQPFMRPAMQQHEPQVLNLYRAELKRGLAREEARLAKQK